MTTEIATQQDSPSKRFTTALVSEFNSAAGQAIILSPEKKRLAQHLFLKIDTALKELEAKRLKAGDNNKQPIIWANINMQKLALNAMHRIDLGLDALIENHIHPIPYWNTKEKRYDLDLRIGYVGKDYYKRQAAINPPKDVIYQLVYSTDTFKPLMKNATRKIESYEFEINNPFDRGEVIGGFAYFIYDDETKNKLMPIPPSEFQKAEDHGNKTFWKEHPLNMKYKTIVTRAMSHLYPDPKKITAAYQAVEEEEEGIIEAEFKVEHDQNANKTPLEIPEGNTPRCDEDGVIIEEQGTEEDLLVCK